MLVFPRFTDTLWPHFLSYADQPWDFGSTSSNHGKSLKAISPASAAYDRSVARRALVRPDWDLASRGEFVLLPVWTWPEAKSWVSLEAGMFTWSGGFNRPPNASDPQWRLVAAEVRRAYNAALAAHLKGPPA